MKILLVPCVRLLSNGKPNPRDYPHFMELLAKLAPNHNISSLTVRLPLNILLEELKAQDLVITIDSFIQHFCWYHGIKCMVLWGPSDYRIFGHKENINVTAIDYRPRPDQFNVWDDVKHDVTLFPTVEQVVTGVNTYKY